MDLLLQFSSDGDGEGVSGRVKRQSPPPEGLELPPISSDGPHPLISGIYSLLINIYRYLSNIFCRLLVFLDNLHLCGCDVSVHFLRVLLERTAEERAHRCGKEEYSNDNGTVESNRGK